MSAAYSPRVVSDGLILSLDFGNEKSWKGRPTTNQFLVPVPNASNDVTFAINGTGTFKRLLTGVYGGYTIKQNDIVYKYDVGTSGCHYHGNSVAIGSGQYVTWSFDFYVSPNVTSYSTNYLANLENYGGSALSGAVTDPTPTVFGAWKRIIQTFGPTSNTGTQAMFLYPGGCNPSALASSGYILYKNPQVEFTSTNIGASPFVSGSRASTDCIFDSTRRFSCNLVGSNFVYPATVGGVKVNNVNDSYVDITPASGLRMGTNDFTLGAWVQQGDTSPNVIVEARDASLLGYLFILNYPSTGQISLFLNTSGTQTTYTITPSISLTTSTAQYLVASVRRAAGTISFYVNGELAGTATGLHFGSISPSSGDIHRLGYDLGGSTTNMTFYSYHIYNRALNALEVKQNYNAVKGRFRL